MKVTTTNQSVFIIPSQDLTAPFLIDYSVYSESERKFVKEKQPINLSEESFFYKLEFNDKLKEAESYILELHLNDTLIYRGSMFATDEPHKYSINDGEYKQHESNNEYIILDNE